MESQKYFEVQIDSYASWGQWKGGSLPPGADRANYSYARQSLFDDHYPNGMDARLVRPRVGIRRKSWQWLPPHSYEGSFDGQVGATFGAFGKHVEDKVALHKGVHMAATEAAAGLRFEIHMATMITK